MDMITKRRLVVTFDALIYKVIHELHVSPSHMAFEDYAQELRIHLFTLADRFDGDIFGKDRFKFTKYAHQGLYWYLIDLLRYDQRRSHSPLVEEYQVKDMPRSQGYEFMLAFWQSAKKHLSESDYCLCRLLYTQECSMQELADYFGVSRKTLYQRRQKLKDKVGQLLQELNGSAPIELDKLQNNQFQNDRCQGHLTQLSQKSETIQETDRGLDQVSSTMGDPQGECNIGQSTACPAKTLVQMTLPKRVIH